MTQDSTRARLLLLAVHAGEETRHLAEWFGAEVATPRSYFLARAV